jgi:hypothetical protein
MRSLLRSLRQSNYHSRVRHNSEAMPGVSYTIKRMSLGRRIELAEAIRDLAVELEFHQAGESARERVTSAALSARIEQVYLRWGLSGISGLLIDGEVPGPDLLYANGPEDLLREIVDQIRLECGLTDEERKN